jgi:hypothetical protein
MADLHKLEQVFDTLNSKKIVDVENNTSLNHNKSSSQKLL